MSSSGRKNEAPVLWRESTGMARYGHSTRATSRTTTPSFQRGFRPTCPTAILGSRGSPISESSRPSTTFDKHRTIHGFSVFPGKGQPINKSLDWNPDAVLVEQRDRESWEPLEDGAELARFRFRPGVKPNVRVTSPIPLQAGFEVEFAEGKAITVPLPSMDRLQIGTKAMIDPFLKFFPPQRVPGEV
jgi:hypothetical protein